MLPRLAGLGSWPSDQRLLEEGGRLPAAARERLGAGLTEIADGLLPQLAPHRVVGEPLDLLGQPVGIERLDGLDDAGVERAPALLEQAPVRTSWVSACLKVYSSSGKRLAS